MRPEAAVTAQPRLGAVARQNRVDFAVWAPAHREVGLVLEGKDDLRMDPGEDGYFLATVAGVHHGQRYWYRLGGQLRPDPASRFQPDGPFGPSMVVDPDAFSWRVGDWAGAARPEMRWTELFIRERCGA
jgi:maltooligosyltrehalose trehalohydrolase